MVSRFSGRDILSRPTCPFCGIVIERPKDLVTQMPSEMPVGRCPCGAVYACDVTGHNLGEAMIEALVFGCHGDWDRAWDLLPEKDYLEAQLRNYDLEAHLIMHGGVYKGRRIAGTLYFIRLQEGIPETDEEGPKGPLERTRAVPARASGKRKGEESFSKAEVESLVKNYKVDALLSMAEKDKKIIRDLQRLLYSVDKGLRWRAADTLGKACAVIAKTDPGAISKLLQRLFTAIADTAASSWGSLDAIGEIMSNRPGQFAGYLPQLYQLARARSLLSEVLRALGKIGAKRPDLIESKANRFIPLLHDPDPEVRGYAAILLGNLSAHQARADLAGLADDSAAIDVYREGQVEKRTIDQLASEALEKLSS